MKKINNSKNTNVLVVVFLFTLFVCVCSNVAKADNTWEKIDRKLKGQIYQINIGIKLYLRNSMWAQLSDLSPKLRYPVFSTTTEDKGFRVVGFGTTFPIKSSSNKIYFITNRHVVESGEQIIKECERFYAGMQLLAEQTAGKDDPNKRFHELATIANLSTKKDMTTEEKTLYQTTVDSIWDTYETYLSQNADPARLLFTRYLRQTMLKHEVGYFLHAPGPANQAAKQAQLYKAAKAENEPDLSLLIIEDKNILPLEFDMNTPAEGQEIQVIGYPAASEQIDADASQYYSPTFNTGRISRVAPHMLQVDAPITTGLSGGPVISQRGKVLGIVAVRAISEHGGELPNFGGAITIQSIQTFAPELFGKVNKTKADKPKNKKIQTELHRQVNMQFQNRFSNMTGR